MEKKDKKISRSTVIDLDITFNDPELSEKEKKKKKAEIKRKIKNSIKLYRSIGRKIFTGAIMAKMATSEIRYKKDYLEVISKKDTVDQILNLAYGGNFKKGKLYGIKPLVKELAPTWLGFVDCSIRGDIYSALKRKDPEFVKASRDWLTINGIRGIGWFKRLGIGCPVATARPKLYKNKLKLKWDHEIGEVEFTIPKLDIGRYLVWKAVRDGIYKLGTIYLNFNDKNGKLKAVISYSIPEEQKIEADPDKRLIINFSKDNPEEFINMTYTDGKKTKSIDSISVTEPINWAKELKIQQKKLLDRKGSIGSPYKPWGSKRLSKGITKRQNNLTKRTEDGKKYYNHLWSKRVATRAEHHKVKYVILTDTPEGKILQGTKYETQWQIYQFKKFLEYKLQEKGIELLDMVSKKEKAK